MPRVSIAAILALFFYVSQTVAHFFLLDPPTIGFDDDLESEAPCGSFTVDFSKDNVTNFHVGGNSIALESIHPQATWLFRATLDKTASGNWTSLLPAVVQTGLGDYCEKVVTVPASWAGSQGVLGVVQDAPDGILYQCAAVNFVAGIQSSIPSACVNVTGLSAEFTTDTLLSSLPASFASSTSTTTSSGTGTVTSPTTTTSKSAANTVVPYSYSGTGSLVGAIFFASAAALTFFV